MNEDERDLITRLTRMETKLDTALGILSDHENRIRAVEDSVAANTAVNKWKATTGLSLFLALAAMISQVVGGFL